jgi:hypothetical protein
MRVRPDIELAIFIANTKGRLIDLKDCGHSGTPYRFRDLGIVATRIDAQRRIRVIPVGGPKREWRISVIVLVAPSGIA